MTSHDVKGTYSTKITFYRHFNVNRAFGTNTQTQQHNMGFEHSQTKAKHIDTLPHHPPHLFHGFGGFFGGWGFFFWLLLVVCCIWGFFLPQKRSPISVFVAVFLSLNL